jgi:hypothetical protein
MRYICELINNVTKMKRSTKITGPFIVAFIVVIGLSCEKYQYTFETIDPVIPVSFKDEIQPIFTAHCILCHHGSRDPDLQEGNSYSSLTSLGFVTSPGETSVLYKQLNKSSHTSFTLPEEKQKILIWINQGAKDN